MVAEWQRRMELRSPWYLGFNWRPLLGHGRQRRAVGWCDGTGLGIRISRCTFRTSNVLRTFARFWLSMYGIKKKYHFLQCGKKKSNLWSTHCKLSQTCFATSASRIGLRSSARGMYPIVSLRRKKNGCFRLHYTTTAAAAAEEEKEEGQEQQQQQQQQAASC